MRRRTRCVRSLLLIAFVCGLLVVGCGSESKPGAKAGRTFEARLSSGGAAVSSSEEEALVVHLGSVVRVSAPGAAGTAVDIHPLVRPGASAHPYLEALASGRKVTPVSTISLPLEKDALDWRVSLRPNYYELDIGRAKLALGVIPSARAHVVGLPLLVRSTCQIVALRPVPPPASVVTDVSRMIDSLGDSHPRSARYLLTTAALANAGTHAGSADGCNEAVFLVEVTGHFVADDVPIPPGAKPPKGTVATATYAAADRGEGTSFGLCSRTYDLARLGRVADLMPYLRGKRGVAKPVSVASVPKP